MPSITPVNHVIFRIVQAPQACLIFLSHIFLSDRQPTPDRKMWDRKMLIVYSLLPLVGLRPTLESGAQERVGSLVKTRKIRGNDDREVINGILYVLTTGCGWEYLPHDIGTSWRTCHRRLLEYQRRRVWHDQRKILETIDSIKIGKRVRRPKRLGLDKGYDS